MAAAGMGWKAAIKRDSLAEIFVGAPMLIVAFWMAAPASNPLALAEQGLVQCWHPDSVNKTCRTIASYRKTGPGEYDNAALLPLSPQGRITIETHTPVVLKGDAVCGPIRMHDATAGILRKDGKIVPPAIAQPTLDKLAQLVASVDGLETCTRYEASGPNLIAKVSISGKYRPDLDSPVKWIGLMDGYIVTP